MRSPQDNTSNDSWSTGQETEGLLEENYPDWLQVCFVRHSPAHGGFIIETKEASLS